MDDIREITGVTEYQRGSSPEITRTATEASIMEGAANVKIKAKLAAIENATRQAGEVILAIAAEVFPQTDVDEISVWIGGEQARKMNDMQVGEEMATAADAGQMDQLGELQGKLGNQSEAVITPTDEMFEGIYEVFVAQGSTEYRNPQAREERFKDMFFSLLQNAEGLQMAQVQVDFNALLRLWLESTDIPDVEQILSQPQAGGMAPPGMDPAQGPPGGEPGMEQMMAMMAGGGGMGGAPGPQPGMPMSGMPSPENSGMMPEQMPQQV